MEGWVVVRRRFAAKDAGFVLTGKHGIREGDILPGDELRVTAKQARELMRRGLAVPCGEGGGVAYLSSTALDMTIGAAR